MIMQRRTFVRDGTSLGAVLLASATVSPARADEATINIDNFTFSPAVVTVKAGTKVVWINRDDIPHLVTDAAQKRAYKSPALDTGDAFSFVFATPGTYKYFCALHPMMQGTVVVK
jgi:plastocyanin